MEVLRRWMFMLAAAVLLNAGLCLELPGLNATGSAAYAQDSYTVTLRAGGVRRVRVSEGQSVTVKSPSQLGEIVVGDPKVADVVPLSQTSVYLLGKAVGRTTVTVYDADNEPIGVVEVEVSVDVTDLQRSIQQHLPGSKVRVQSVNGRVRLAGKVQNGQALSVVLDLARQYAGDNIINALEVTESQQVSLEVRFVEVSRSAGRELGINWAVTEPGRAGQGFVTGDVGYAVGRDAVGNSVYLPGTAYGNAGQGGVGSAAIGAFAFAATGNAPFATLVTSLLRDSINIDLFIRALEQKGLARRLAEPTLTTLSGEKAKFLAGGEVPFQTRDDEGIKIEFKEFGVKLNFLPTVLSNGLINLKLQPEVSQIDPSIIVNGNPGFITRNADVTVELRDGQSFAIAGLLQALSRKNVDQVPWIGNIPIIGAVFRSQGFIKQETDLAVIVTPRLIRPTAPDEPLATPLDTSRGANDPEFFLFGKLEVTEDHIRAYETGANINGPYGHEVDLKVDDANVLQKK